jgi:hypothetical protein
MAKSGRDVKQRLFKIEKRNTDTHTHIHTQTHTTHTVARVMGRLQRGAAALTESEEGWGPEKGPGGEGKVQPNGATTATRQLHNWQKKAAAAAMQQQSLRVSLYCKVALPPTLEGVAAGSGESCVCVPVCVCVCLCVCVCVRVCVCVCV